VTSREQDVEFFELAADGSPLGPDDPFEPGDQPPESGHTSIRARVAALPAQVRALPAQFRAVPAQVRAAPDSVKVLAASCVLAAAVGGFAFGHASHRAPAAVSSPLASASAAGAPVAASSPDPASVPVPRRGARPLGLGVTSCRGISDVAVVPFAPTNLIQAIKAHLPTATVDTGSSVTNELGTACTSTVNAHAGASAAGVTLTVTAPPTTEQPSVTTSMTGQDPTLQFEERLVTADGWTVDVVVNPASDSSITEQQLSALVNDPSVIKRAAG
jgi:hypothetical protein